MPFYSNDFKTWYIDTFKRSPAIDSDSDRLMYAAFLAGSNAVSQNIIDHLEGRARVVHVRGLGDFDFMHREAMEY